MHVENIQPERITSEIKGSYYPNTNLKHTAVHEGEST